MKKINEMRLIKILKSLRVYLLLFAVDLFVLDVVFREAYKECGITEVWDKTPIMFTICWCVLLTSIALVLPGIIKKIYMIAVALVYAVLVLVHCGLSGFNGSVFSFSDIQFAGDGAAFFSMDYLYIRKMVLVTIVVYLLVAIIAVFLIPKEKYSIVRVMSSILLFGVSVGGINYVKSTIYDQELFLSWDNYQRKNAIYENFTDSNKSIMLTGLYQYTFRDFCLSFGVYDILTSGTETIENLDEYYEQVVPDEDNQMTGVFEGKNLILIQLEAIDTWMINDICMPTLTALKGQSTDFTQHYAPMYLAAGTFNTESIVNTGLVSPFTGAKTTVYTRNSYPFSAANLFKEEGYVARSFHNSRGDVYDRDISHLNWGYEQYYSGTDMGMPDIELDSNLISGYDLMVNSEENFFSFIVTYSGHGAYLDSTVSEMYYDQFEALLPEGTNEMIIHAYAHAYETDLFIKALIEQLERDGFLENTVLAFYSDHYNYYVLDDQLIMDQKGINDKNMIQSTAFFIYSQDIEPQEVTKVTSSIDVLPTLVNMFDLNTDGRYYTGNDAFSENGGYAIFADYSWYDGEQYWNSATDSADTEKVIQRNEEIQERLKISWDTLNSNYLYHLE